MSQTVSLVLSPQTRRALEAIEGTRRHAVKHVLCARIVLLSDARLSVLEVARQAGVSRPMVWRWQQRFAEDGLDGLLRGEMHPPGTPAALQALVQAVLEHTLTGVSPGATTHWTGHTMAAACSLSLRTVQRLWHARRLQPDPVRTFKRSTDPRFAAKPDDVVKLYIAPPRHALMLSIDEKSLIQELDRTQPGLPLKPGKCAPLAHDYVRNGTTTLLAALDTLQDTVFGRYAPRHRHQEFIALLDQVEDTVPAGKVTHAIMDNYAAHEHPDVLTWLADNPRWMFYFTPTSCSWLNAVEGFFSSLTYQVLRRGVFRSVDDLVTTIDRYVASANDDPKPFAWTASTPTIMAKLRTNYSSESQH